MKQQRIYLVGHGQDMRLVRAAHRAQALGHVARSLINVKVASQDELVHAMQNGIKIESATEIDTNDMFAAGEDQQAA
jgi:hypothetical protein